MPHPAPPGSHIIVKAMGGTIDHETDEGLKATIPHTAINTLAGAMALLVGLARSKKWAGLDLANEVVRQHGLGVVKLEQLKQALKDAGAGIDAGHIVDQLLYTSRDNIILRAALSPTFKQQMVELAGSDSIGDSIGQSGWAGGWATDDLVVVDSVQAIGPVAWHIVDPAVDSWSRGALNVIEDELAVQGRWLLTLQVPRGSPHNLMARLDVNTVTTKVAGMTFKGERQTFRVSASMELPDSAV